MNKTRAMIRFALMTGHVPGRFLVRQGRAAACSGNRYKQRRSTGLTRENADRCPSHFRRHAGRPGNREAGVRGWTLVDLDYLQHEMFGVCYAESTDGIHWDRPDLELVA